MSLNIAKAAFDLAEKSLQNGYRKIMDYPSFIRDNVNLDYTAWKKNSEGYFKSDFDATAFTQISSAFLPVKLNERLGFEPASINDFAVYIRFIPKNSETTFKLGRLINFEGSWGRKTAQQTIVFEDYTVNQWLKLPVTENELTLSKQNPLYVGVTHLVFSFSQISGAGSFEFFILDTRSDMRKTATREFMSLYSDQAKNSDRAKKADVSDVAVSAQNADNLKGFNAFEKVVLTNIATASVPAQSTNTIAVSPYSTGLENVGYRMDADIKDGYYTYAYARLTGDKKYVDLKNKKVKFVFKSDVPVSLNIRLTNSGAWGSPDNTVGISFQKEVNLTNGNNLTQVVDVDFSSSQIEAFYAATNRQTDNLQRIFMITTFNEGVVNKTYGQSKVYVYAYYNESGTDLTGEMTSKYIAQIPSKKEFDFEVNSLKSQISSSGTTIPEIVTIGDSLTAGGGWTTDLQSLSGIPVFNAGTGGENTQTITARQGADVMMVNNITIPADTSEIQLGTYASGIPTQFGKKATPLLQGGSSHVNPSYIDGIEGTLRWTGAAYNDTNGVWMWKRNTAGTEKTINRPTALITNLDKNHNKGIMVIFMGQNGGYANDAELVNLHKLMIRHSKAKHVFILGLSSGSASSRSAYESAMKTEFGRYFFSLREYLSQYGLSDAGLTPTQADTDAMATGTAPPQLFTDGIHYTTATKTVIGKAVYKKMSELNLFS